MIAKPSGVPPRTPVAAKTSAAPAKAAEPVKAATALPKLGLVPESAKTVTRSKYAFVLVLGPPKSGKTTACAGTAPQPAYVINTERPDDLLPAKEVTDEFLHNTVHSWGEMNQAIVVAQSLAKKGAIQTVVLDTLSSFSEYLSEECLASSAQGTQSGMPDGRKAWPDYEKRLKNVIRRLERLPCHVIVVSHFQDFTSESEEKDAKGGKKIPKVGDGIVPLLYGRARLSVGGLFANVVYLDKGKDGKRLFLTDIDGVWGPGCRYIKGVQSMPADIKVLIKHMKLGE